MNKTVMTIIAIATAAVIAAGAFWAGSFYQSRRFLSGRQLGFPGAPGQGQRFGQPGARQPGDGVRNGARPGGERVLKGRLDRIDDEKLTLTTQLGSIKVTIAEDAQIERTQKAEPGDLKVGKQLIIQSTVDAAGELTAKSIIQD